MEMFVVWMIVGFTALWLLRKLVGSWRALATGQTTGGCPSCSSKNCCRAAQCLGSVNTSDANVEKERCLK